MERVRITDVGPRDGLQNEAGRVSTARKADLVRAVAASGVDEVEITSFVSPKWIPQLGDAAELCALVAESKPAGVVYSALVPNEVGMGRLLAANEAAAEVVGDAGPLIGKASVFTSASETFSRKNTNASIAETYERFRPVIAMAHGAGLRVRGYVSCVIACPFEGAVEPGAVARVAADLAGLGVDEIDLGDTIGAGTAENTIAMLEAVKGELGEEWFGLPSGAEKMTLHLHDTFGRAVDCVRAGLDVGVRSFDGAVGGLGGCPYASTPGKRAPGNISTLGLVAAVEEAGFETGVDRGVLMEAERLAAEVVAEARAQEAAASEGGEA